MLSPRKQLRIISLGEIVTPHVMKTIQAFIALIAEKKKVANLAINLQEIGQSIGGVLERNKHLINNFKLGKLDEKDFTEQMIHELKKATTIEIDIHEFDDAWNAMNPKFEEFAALLKQAIEYHQKQQIVFISFTNPKDIRHLIKELEKNKQDYKVVNDQLIEIAGIPLYTTYAVNQNKTELIETTIKKFAGKSLQSTLAKSMTNLLNLEKDQASELDIKYIRCVNNIQDPILKEDLDKTNQAIEKKTAEFFVETILWMKQEQSLSDVLNHPQIPPKLIASLRL